MRERMYMTGVASALLAAWLLAPGPRIARAGSNAQPELTVEERHRLDQGELVERRLVREQGDLRLIGGTSWQVIEAQPGVVWQALLDTPYYRRMLPQVTEARVVTESARSRTLFMQHGVGFVQTSYYLDVRLDHERRDMTFRIDPRRPRGIRAAWGFYAVRSYGHDKTLLAYGVMADIGDGLGRMLVSGSVHEWMMKVPWMVKRFVEGSGRYLYGRHSRPVPKAALVAAR
jgi:hypothetical protein